MKKKDKNILPGGSNRKEIAVIGLSLRFPKSNTLDEFRNHLVSGKSLVTEVPPQRWDKDEFFGDPGKETNKTNSIWGGFIDDADSFDASFFNISPREAMFMDPQQRIALELAWQAVEDAGYRASSLHGSKTGVFMGVCNTDYTELIEKHVREVNAYIPTGTSFAIVSNRISYWFDFKGPSITIDTACASSLVALHQAVCSLNNKECDYALAGGVNLCWSPTPFIALSQSGMLSKDGKCKAFDDQADGYVRGEGGAILFLRPLNNAIVDHDHIYAVIKGTGTNHGGRTNSLTITNPKAQAQLITAVYEEAGVSPDTVSYLEAHGPGTPLGDPIEIYGLKLAFNQLYKKWNKKPQQSVCGIGSVKTNIGHLESAAGTAGVVKVIASMTHKILPASIHFHQLNHVINLEDSPFYIVSETKPWEVSKHTDGSLHPRRAGVSSFGFGGCNAHILLEEYIPGENQEQEQSSMVPATPDGPVLIPLSAKNANSLRIYAEKLLEFLKRTKPVSHSLRPSLEQVLTAMLSEILRVKEEELDPGQAFDEYGIEPVHRTEFQNRLREKLRVEIPVREFQEINSITAMAAYLLELCPKSIEAWLSTSPQDQANQSARPAAGKEGRQFSHHPHQKIHLAKLAYTLQVGREAMEERVIFLVKDIPELIRKLETFCERKETIDNCWQGQVKKGREKDREIANLCTGDEDSRELTRKWIARGGLKKIARIWVQGLAVDWELFYKKAKPRRISLPTYPFTRERYWIPGMTSHENQATAIIKGTPGKSETTAGSHVSNIPAGVPGKPRGISLKQVSDHRILANKPVDQIPSSITLSPTGMPSPPPGTNAGSNPGPQVHAVLPTGSILEELQTSLAQALYMERSDVDIDKEFVEMGLDSIVGVEWVQAINRKYGTSITAARVYDYPTLREFAGFLEKEPGQNELSRQQSPGISLPGNNKESIAIVGMSGRYPGAGHLHQYWDNLVQARSFIKEIPVSRWDVNQYYDPRPAQKEKIYCKWLGILEDMEYFDAQFFNISPAEAELMDPQQRLFLQEGWKAFEDAGCSSRSLSDKKCGVYLGIMSGEYGMMLAQSQMGAASAAGSSSAMAAARIAYYLNLKGPAIAIDTSCSSSLAATHLGCQALLNHEIDIALVGGVSLFLTPGSYIAMCAAGMLSADGQCKPFDNHANGFVPGEGVGALVLKRLKDAESDHDPIYGVIIGSGINHNGKTNGITSPSMKSQVELEQEIYDKYKIDPAGIGYVEAHGSGTKLGDLIELEALSTVYKKSTRQRNYCAIGSVKSSIGHTSAASGAASLQKVLLCMKHKTLVPGLNFKEPNEHFNLEDSPFYVITECQNWETAPNMPRRAAVSSFGYSGTNAHMVIEEYLAGTGTARNTDNSILFVLSAKSKEQLIIYAGQMKDWIASHEDINLTDMAYTLQLGRDAREFRLAIPADSRESLLKGLTEFTDGNVNGKVPAGVLTGRVNINKEDNHESVAVAPGDEVEDRMHSRMQKADLEKVARIWVTGGAPDWNQLYDTDKPRRINLPTYPFAGERYWLPDSPRDHDNSIKQNKNPDNKETGLSSGPDKHYDILPEVYTYDELFLADHTVDGERVLIGMTHGGLALNAFFKIFPRETGVHLSRLCFVESIEVKEGQRVEVLVEPTPKGPGLDFQVMYRYESSATWKLTASGKLHKTLFDNKRIDIESLKDSLAESQHWLRTHIYTANPVIGLGDSFKTVTHLYTGKDRVLARIALNRTSREENHEYVLHPLITNSAFQVIFSLLKPVDHMNCREGFLPFGINDIYFRKTEKLEQCWLLVKLVKNSGEMVIFDAQVINDDSRVVVQYLGCSMKRLRTGSGGRTGTKEDIIPVPNKIQKYLMDKVSKIIPDPANTKLSTLSYLEMNLMDLGLKSSQLVALTNEIETEINIELNPTLFFEYLNIKELTRYFSREHRDSFAKFLGKGNTGAEPGTAGTNTAVCQTGEIISPKVPPKAVPGNSMETINSLPGPNRDDIAVIGIHGLFAGASHLDGFWNYLRDKRDVIKEIPPDHWDYRPWFDDNPEARDKTYCKWGSFIDDVDKFDAEFFNISPREAEWMDPQLRLLLQSIYAAAEDAGYINRLRGTDTGVFVGVCCHDYAERIAEMNLPVEPYIGTGNSQTVIANRVSFNFDLTGPSIAVDTACSSSLFALHQACQALHRKECGMAFTAGVNLLLSSWHYRYFCSIAALSPTGLCHTFDEAADGYVPGECIASILLKPLKQAQRDKDHIYTVIKGSAALHGGYTPSLTAPSIAGEENVILKAWEDAGIHPETLSYIEAHGTGTKLGDPIEINSLIKAFKRFTDREHFCAIGSAKATIGHTEGAAGLAGILKVILQMKHRQIPALPHFKKLNPFVQLDKSALYINRELEEWKSPAGVPRKAGISSFGFSGAYAHVVLEEYIPENEDEERPQHGQTSQTPAIIVLSAKNKARLREQAQRLLAAITHPEQQLTDSHLADIAYTLQVGREPMEERLAVVVESLKQLEEKLKEFLDGPGEIADLYQGQVTHDNETLAMFAGDEDEEFQEAIDRWLQRYRYGKLPELWVRGLGFNWNRLYDDTGSGKPRRISLPTYPFARERYWLPEVDTVVSRNAAAASTAFLHPLVQQNTSDLAEQRYSSIFTGQEFFLADHVLRGERILPGVVYLEMARAAVALAASPLGSGVGNQIQVRLKQVVWVRPIIVGNEPVQVHIGLFPEANGEIAFEIYSETSDPEAETIVHCQGTSVPAAAGEAEVPTLDIPSWQSACSQNRMTADQCYETIRTYTGLNLGPRLQGVKSIRVGSGQALAKLVLPDAVPGTKGQWVLHPGIMDSSFQTPISLMVNPGEADTPGDINPPGKVLPFALQELEVFGRFPSSVWALVKYCDGSSAGDTVQKLDIDLCDEQGKICVRMKGLSYRVLESEMSGASLESAETHGTLMLHPCWNEQPAAHNAQTAAPVFVQHLVILCEPGKKWKQGIQEAEKRKKEEAGPPVQIMILQSQQETIEQRFQEYALGIFEEIQGINIKREKQKSRGRVLFQVVIPDQEEQQIFFGLSALLKTAQLENPGLTAQLIGVDPGEDAVAIIRILEENSRCPDDSLVHCQDGKRRVHGWQQVAVSRESTGLPWKDGGIYLVTGGAGGLGLLFAGEIIRQVRDVTLILAGQSELFGDRQVQVEALQSLPPSGSKVTVEYRQVDVTDEKAIIDLIQGIRADSGGLNGIIHSAGVIRDNYIINKTGEELLEVLAPKVSGLAYLDRASQNLDLDFFICFSSLAGCTGSMGQADYSTANAFMDAYARYRNTLAAKNQRRGQSLSINWPLWQDGGMRVHKETETMLRQNTGMIPMQTSIGMQMFYQALASGNDQVMVITGNLTRLKQKFLPARNLKAVPPGKKAVSNSSDSTTGIDTNGLLDKVEPILINRAAKVMKLKPAAIDSHTGLSKYGFDSIALTEFTNTLNKELKLELTPPIFFEYPTLRDFAAYLVREHQDVLAAKFSARTRFESPLPVTGDTGEIETKTEQIPGHKRQRRRFAGTTGVSTSKPKDAGFPEPIAVIGMSGRFPMAGDLHEFLENLLEGRDCITEIPQDRWDWRKYYGDPNKEANKTNIKWGGFIDGIAEFDPLFFGISPREAQFMDLPQRLLMTYAWKAIEDSGYSAQGLSGTRTALFVGTAVSGYVGLISRSDAAIEGYTSTGMAPSVGPGRMSYFLDIHGPSEPVDTACSSALVAVHRAVEAIINGTCDMAIVGGVNTIVTPDLYISFSKAGMLCEDGRCKTFSRQANGYVRGEGVGMVVLKKLKAAEQDGDHIYGIIRSTAENHGGRTNSLTAPNPRAQAELLKTAYTRAGIDPGTVTYIEAHGTGTQLGDPIEINGLKTAFRDLYRSYPGPRPGAPHCGLGSVKTNIGHLELAAGIAGMIKVLLQLQHKTLFKSLHCHTINPYIQLENTPFYIVRETMEWKAQQDRQGNHIPRRAGVSSFGFSGTNAHVVLEEYIPGNPVSSQTSSSTANTALTTASAPVPAPFIIVLSAKNEDRLMEQVRLLLEATRDRGLSDANLADMAYTLQVGREPMEERLAVIVNSIEELREKLEEIVKGGEDIEELYRGQVNRNKDTLAIIAGDEDMVKTIDAWIAKGKYPRLLDLWVRGLIFDWNRLYGDRKPRRISLPTYPFARERYWVPGSKPGSTGSRTSTSLSETPASPHPSPTPPPQQKSGIPGKPTGIALQSLSTPQSPAPEPAGQTRQAIELPSTGTSSSTSLTPLDTEPEPMVHIPAGVSREAIEEELLAAFAEAFKLSRLDVEAEDHFSDMGLDPIMTAQWVQSINRQYGTSITVTGIFDYSNIRQLSAFLETESNKPGSRIPSPPDTKSAESTGSLLEKLKTSLAQALYLEREDVDADKKLVDLGLDSIVGVEWIQAINKQFGTSIAATRVYDYPSIREFAGFLEKQLKKPGAELKPAPGHSTPCPADSLALPDVLKQVYQGSLDIKQAEKLVRDITG